MHITNSFRVNAYTKLIYPRLINIYEALSNFAYNCVKNLAYTWSLIIDEPPGKKCLLCLPSLFISISLFYCTLEIVYMLQSSHLLKCFLPLYLFSSLKSIKTEHRHCAKTVNSSFWELNKVSTKYSCNSP